jgi:hypothetical protein
MARGSRQKQIFMVSKAIFSLVAVKPGCMELLKVVKLIKLIKILFISERPQNDALANPPHFGAPYPMKPPQLDYTHVLDTPKVPPSMTSGQSRLQQCSQWKKPAGLTGKASLFRPNAVGPSSEKLEKTKIDPPNTQWSFGHGSKPPYTHNEW